MQPRTRRRLPFGLSFLAALLATSLMPAFAAAQSPPASQDQAQTTPGGPSQAEARALGYLHTVWTAQWAYKKKHGEYAKSLASLVGSSSFTRRMASPERGDYTAHFTSNGTNFSVGMVPKTFDAEHRAFFINETGTVRMEPDKPAGPQSEVFKQK